MTKLQITRDLAVKVLKIVDAGLIQGVGQPVPGQMCVEAAVCYALGEPHGDKPSCVGSAVRAYKIRLNDARWSSDAARTAGMRELAIAQLGSDTIDQMAFAERISIETVKQVIARLCRSRGETALADECAAVTTRKEACTVAKEVEAALRKKAYAADAYTYAYAYAYADAAAYAADAADVAYAYADADAAYADAAAYAYAAAAAYAYAAAERDAVLRFAARMATNILIELKSPGAEWLDLVA